MVVSKRLRLEKFIWLISLLPILRLLRVIHATVVHLQVTEFEMPVLLEFHQPEISAADGTVWRRATGGMRSY